MVVFAADTAVSIGGAKGRETDAAEADREFHDVGFHVWDWEFVWISTLLLFSFSGYFYIW